ncbi:alpha/beta hydrolase [Paraburkholderia sp. MPAMCS5]|uniref:alpha/beta hydrolase n=1 Tax=Paraburkholderia sp. MPAMCS5 TaxID=3112563 RepID=UPI002E1966B3|nr:alpha/beta hydrolase [Paraburkholderia sp. MPAMCS5]
MPLDPHLGAVLAQMAASGRKPMHECSVQEGRDLYLALTYGSRTPEQVVPVGSVEDAFVDGGAGPLRARIYRPNGSGPFPTVAFFHGGGFVIGDLDTHDNMCRELCRGSQAVVVSVDYRLAPEHPFPAAVDDAIAATRWVVAHAKQLGGEDVVAVAGDSAGGNLAAVVAQQLAALGTLLAAQFLIYPAVDNTWVGYPSIEKHGRGYFLEQETLGWFFDHYTGASMDLKDARLAPIKASSLSGLPPAVIVTAEFDPLRDQGEAYGIELHAAGSKADMFRCEGMIHGFFDMGRWSPVAQRFIRASIERFGLVVHGTYGLRRELSGKSLP